jgi:hypothetical protein
MKCVCARVCVHVLSPESMSKSDQPFTTIGYGLELGHYSEFSTAQIMQSLKDENTKPTYCAHTQAHIL